MNSLLRLSILASFALLLGCARMAVPGVAVVAESSTPSSGTPASPIEPAQPMPSVEARVSEGKPGKKEGPEEQYSADLLYEVLVAEVAGQRGRLDVAVNSYLSAARASDDPKIAERATRVAIFARDEDTALIAAQRWIELDPDNVEAHQVLAALYLHKGDQERALSQVERVLALTGGETDRGFALIAGWLSREPDQAAALELMGRVVDRHPGSPDALLAYAQLAIRANQPALALEKVENALKLKPEWTDLHILRAQIRIRQGEMEQALAEMEQAVAANPKDTKLRLTYARLLVEAQRLDEARSQFELLAEQSPGNPDVLYALGLLALDAKHLDDAQRYFSELAGLGQRVDEAHYYLGRIAENREQFTEARHWYAKVGQGEYYLEAQIRIASMLAKEGNVQGARDHLQGLRMQDPDSAVRIYLAEGEILHEAGRSQEAMTLYSEAILLFPDSNDLLYARALLAERLDQLDVTERDLRKVLERDPDNAYALNALGYTLADRTDRYAEAAEYIKRALELLPDDPAVIDSMGWVQYRLGNHEESLKYLRRAFEMSGDAEIAAHLGEVLWVSGRRDEAREVWAQGMERDPKNRVLVEVMKRFNP